MNAVTAAVQQQINRREDIHSRVAKGREGWEGKARWKFPERTKQKHSGSGRWIIDLHTSKDRRGIIRSFWSVAQITADGMGICMELYGDFTYSEPVPTNAKIANQKAITDAHAWGREQLDRIVQLAVDFYAKKDRE